MSKTVGVFHQRGQTLFKLQLPRQKLGLPCVCVPLEHRHLRSERGG